MKITITTMLLLFSSLAIAQNYQGISETDMQRMMQEAQKMQACMQNLDQQKLQALGEKAKQVESEIKALCTNGKRKQAEKKGYEFAQEMNTNPEIAAARKCGEMLRGMMPSFSFADETANESGGHICDDM